MSQMIRIGLAMSWNLAYCRRVLRGVTAYARAQPDWLLIPIDADDSLPTLLKRLRLSAVLAHVYDARTADTLRQWRRPVVNVSGILPTPGLHRVGIDDEAVGRCAAAHLLERGMRHFAFVGHARHAYSIARETGFCDVLDKGRSNVERFHRRLGRDPFQPQGGAWALDPRLIAWLVALPKPAGVFACNDIWGVQLAEACRQAKLRVPHEVTIVGVDNDDLLCEIARPTLSSVAIPHEQIGIAAAERLASILGRSGAAPLRPLLFKPSGVIARQSSDMLVTTNPDAAAAVRLIRNGDARVVTVADVVHDVPTSRRTLERAFRRDFGMGIHRQIRQTRLERAQRLLVETSLAMPDVAQQSGFSSAKHLSRSFRQFLSTTPTQYRRAYSMEKRPRT